MYCLFCGARLPEDALFCLQCGKLTSRGTGESTERTPNAPTATSVSSPSDPYNPRPSTYYGPPSFERETQNPYTPLNPYVPLVPPPPPHRRFSPGFLKSLVSGILVILLLGGGLGGWLLFKHGTSSPSVTHTPKPMAASQPTVQSTSRPTATPQPTSTTAQSLPGTWTQCAAENATCAFNDAMTVAFGAKGSFHYATESNGTACTTTIFGDPIFGTPKACYIEAAPPTTNKWTQCAAENATCSFLGTMTVAFGANSSFHYATESNGTACTDTVFGDPIFGTPKACYIEAAPPTTNKWVQCAAENNTCSFTGKHEVAYGANGEYFYGIFTSGTVCSNNVFGDPASNVVKACYYQ